MEKVTNKIIEVLRFIPKIDLLKIQDSNTASLFTNNGQELLEISLSDIKILGNSVYNKLLTNPSPLSDSFVQTDQIKHFFDYLIGNNLFQRLNHLGICCLVDSIIKEKVTLANEIKKIGLHLYEEPSHDESTWLFIGDIKNWDDPFVEFVFIERTTDKWKDYWLPHFQIDIDTYLNGDEIEKLIIDSFHGKIKPYRIIETEKFTALVRARLGILSGININLDIGFEGRMTRYHRTRVLQELT